MDVELRVDQVKEFLDVSQELLADALACAVDAELDPRSAVQDGRGEQADGYGLANC